MRLKITSKGGPENTTVVNAETGEVIKNVKRVTWTADATGCLAEAVITVAAVPVVIETDAVVVEETVVDGSADEGVNQ